MTVESQSTGPLQPERSLGITEAHGAVRVARQVLTSIVINTALQIPGVIRVAQTNDQWSRFLGRETPRQGVSLAIKENTVSVDLYLVVSSGSHIVEVGKAVQEEVAAAIENIIGMHIHEINVYIQDVE